MDTVCTFLNSLYFLDEIVNAKLVYHFKTATKTNLVIFLVASNTFPRQSVSNAVIGWTLQHLRVSTYCNISCHAYMILHPFSERNNDRRKKMQVFTHYYPIRSKYVFIDFFSLRNINSYIKELTTKIVKSMPKKINFFHTFFYALSKYTSFSSLKAKSFTNDDTMINTAHAQQNLDITMDVITTTFKK